MPSLPPSAFTKRIEIRWRDMDAFKHVNNAVYATYFEEVRDEWLLDALGIAAQVVPNLPMRAAMRRAAFKWNGLALTFQLNAANSSVPPPIPRFMALQPDADESLVASITDWSRNGGDASGDFGRPRSRPACA